MNKFVLDSIIERIAFYLHKMLKSWQDFNEILEAVDKEHSDNFVSREAVEALRLAAITVGEEYSSLILCLMDDKIYDEAKEFLDGDSFPSDVQDAFKAVAMAKLKGWATEIISDNSKHASGL